MIYLTRLNGEKISINIELIEIMETTPDTLITLTTGKKLIVKENILNVQSAIINYRRAINSRLKK
ncbi:MAG: flagellar FlbD family protein [Syntrophomonadaceae bacterium]|mgnify:CR=1 FL=1|nr:flagellar FlbD family protein [Syntrophomonadaceae bacterium]